MIKVAHLLNTFEVGGTELNAVRLMERLDKTAFDVRALCFSDIGPLGARVRAAGVPVVSLGVAGLVSLKTAHALRRLRAYLRHERIDIVHSHDIYTNMLAVPVARLARTPVVLASRRWWSETNHPLHPSLNRFAYRFADRVLANASGVAGLLREVEGLPAQKVMTITNFVDDNAFVAPADEVRQDLMRRLGIQPGERVLGMVANLRRVKGHRELIRAFASAVAGRPRVRLVLVGEGDERGPIEELARSLGIEGQVSLPGQFPHSPSPHWCFDISVLSSFEEGFPNSVVEAMAAGRPVVSTNVGGVPDAVIEGTTGYMVRPNDPAAMATAISKLLDDPAAALAMGTAASQVARERFHASRVVSGLEGQYRSLLHASTRNSTR